MSRQNVQMNYPNVDFHIVFQSSVNEDEFYGLDELERRKLKIIQSKYGCRHCFHTLPDKVKLNLHRFIWNDELNLFEIETKKVPVQLNKLEETVVEYFPEEKLC